MMGQLSSRTVSVLSYFLTPSDAEPTEFEGASCVRIRNHQAITCGFEKTSGRLHELYPRSDVAATAITCMMSGV
ncbi:hypothetical protein CHELA20_53906 [Hyphomicrobiales bacterium]|nr:hypothetical protein CHELA41_21021 [Hyphomicrobiales bacterium]CAH1685186.1 hypothetical protein CHELA20_53906 [Hyphomicrobiales bacterium]